MDGGRDVLAVAIEVLECHGLPDRELSAENTGGVGPGERRFPPTRVAHAKRFLSFVDSDQRSRERKAVHLRLARSGSLRGEKEGQEGEDDETSHDSRSLGARM